MGDEDENPYPAVRDRMPDLKAINPDTGSKMIGKELNEAMKGVPKEEQPECQGFEKGDPLGIFFNIAKKVQNNCHEMEMIKKLYKKQAWDLTNSIDVESAKKAQGLLDKIHGRAKGIIKGVKAVMDKMDQLCTEQKERDDKAAADAGEEPDPGSMTPVYRVMYNCKWSLLTQWRTVNKAYNEEQAGCERRRRANLKRQLKIANDGQEPEDSEIEERMKSGATDVFSGGMVAKSADEDFAAEFLAEAKEKEDAINMIVEKMNELKELWDQFELLLQKQGELLNQIGANLDKAQEFVDKANADLDSALEHQAAAQKKQLMMVGVCALIILILVVPMMVM